jgi:hypothetical protein
MEPLTLIGSSFYVESGFKDGPVFLWVVPVNVGDVFNCGIVCSENEGCNWNSDFIVL